MADSQYITVRVLASSSWPNSPAHTGTENIITLPTPKPATPSAIVSRRPSRSCTALAASGS